MSGLWSAQQREWLQALGHPLLVLAGDEAAAVAAPPEPAAAFAPRPSIEPEGDAPVPLPAPGSADRRLHRALLRATGQRTTRAAEHALARLDPDFAALRNDPSAKRALWPRLRALRRSGRQ